MSELTNIYWICDDCARARGSDMSHELRGITIIKGICGWCKTYEGFLTPVRDFKWKSGRPLLEGK